VERFISTNLFGDTFPGLFLPQEPAWEVLKRLNDYFDAQDYQETLDDLGRKGTVLTETLVLHRGELLPASGRLRVVFTGKRPRAELDGEEITDAAILMAGSILVGERFRLMPGVVVEAGAYLKGPLVVGAGSEIRQGAYLRGNCLIGDHCVVGHATECKNAVFLHHAKAGHFAYVGDSILGNHVNLGAGTKLANLRFARGEITIRAGKERIATGLGKLGAILGDRAQTGCNAVTNPGTVLGKRSMVLPNTTAPSGYHPPGTVIR